MRGLLSILLALAPVLCPLDKAAAAPPRPALAVTKLAGGTGETTSRMLISDLQRGGYFRLVEPGGEPAHSIIGVSSGGRLAATILDPAGEVLAQVDYDGAFLSRNIHQLADDIVVTITGMPGIATSQISFVSEKDGAKQVFVCDCDGDNLRRITRGRRPDVSPSLSAGGRFLWHTSYRDGHGDIYLTNLLNGESQRVISAPGTNSGLALSPIDGRVALIMSFTGTPELFVARPAQGSLRQLSEAPGVKSSPAWSPDGRRIVFAHDEGAGPRLKLIPAEGGKIEPLDVGRREALSPAWSPRGREIAFATPHADSSAVGIYNLESGVSRMVRTGGAAEPAWGPGGKHLLYTLGGELWFIDLETGEERLVLKEMGRISEPDWGR